MLAVVTAGSAASRRRPRIDRPNGTHGTQMAAFGRHLAQQERCHG
jgi:hypothetical protein